MFYQCPLSGGLCFRFKTITNYKMVDGQPVLFNVCNECTGYDIVWKSFLKNIFSLLTIDKILPQEEYLFGLNSIKNKDQLNAFLYSLAQQRKNIQEILPCSHCGAELKDIVNQTKMGCGECYNHFKEIIKQVVEKVQNGSISHVGKVPKCRNQPKETIELPQVKPEEVKQEIQEETKIEKLQKEMDSAILQERYEDAAVIRDEIKKLKGGS